MSILVATEAALPGLTHSARRIERLVGTLVRNGGGVLIAPLSERGPLMIPGVRHLDPGVPVGAKREHVGEIVCDLVRHYVRQKGPKLVHCLGVRAAIGAMTGSRTVRVVLEPGQMPSQMVRDRRREIPAAQLADLVALEDKAIRRANIVVARNHHEAATLIGRGADSDGVIVVPDGLPEEIEGATLPDLPSMAMMVSGPSDGDMSLLLEALVRLKRPFRMTLFHDGQTLRPDAQKMVAQSDIADRVEIVPIDSDLSLRLASIQLLVCAPVPGRSLSAGGWLPETVPWALATGLPCVAPDTPGIRAYAGGSPVYYEPGHAGQLYEGIDSLLGDVRLRHEAKARIDAHRSKLTWNQSDELVSQIWTTQMTIHQEN